MFMFLGEELVSTVVYARLCHYDVIAFVSVLRLCSLFWSPSCMRNGPSECFSDPPLSASISPQDTTTGDEDG